MRVNVRGVFLAMKHEIAAMLDGGRPGSIVNIASTNSFRPQHDQPAYTASKHAVLGLTRSAAFDYAEPRHPGERDLPGSDRHPDAAQRDGASGTRRRHDRSSPEPDRALR